VFHPAGRFEMNIAGSFDADVFGERWMSSEIRESY
jgi:hypothetical protein